jgi:ABC-type multidrug transport system ATPase subunit
VVFNAKSDSRASILLLDDVLSAGMDFKVRRWQMINLTTFSVDSHTAHHIYHSCLKGELVKGRTVVLVSHHVQLCASGASYIVVLDNGRVQFRGDREQFHASDAIKSLVQSTKLNEVDPREDFAIESVLQDHPELNTPGTSSDAVPAFRSAVKLREKTLARKLIEEETRAVGGVARKVWKTYLRACGGMTMFILHSCG